jgi:hypothetical protein
MTLKMEEESDFYLFNTLHPLPQQDHLDLDDLLQEKPHSHSLAREGKGEGSEGRENRLLG